MKGGTAFPALNPDFSAVTFHDPFADSQTYSDAWIFCPGVQPLKDCKDPLGILWLDAYAVIAYGHLPVIAR